MPPGSINQNNTPSISNVLTQEETTELIAQFEQHRKVLKCPHCEKQGLFRRNGHTKTEPPQALFRCTSCGSSYRAITMRSIIHSCISSSTQISPTESVEVSRPSQTSLTHQLDSLGSQSGDVQSLLNMIQHLTQELEAARSEIEQLRTTTIQLQNQFNHERLTSNQPTPPVITNTQSSFDIPEPTPTASPWRNPDQVRRLKESLMQQRQQRRQQRQEAAARILQPPSENQGFKYIYLPTKARVPIGQLRSRLRKLDINNNRILDIHYPDRNVVALLVHNDYTDELRSHLQRFKVTLKDDFNPCDPKLLRDPQYADASDEERANLAFMHHCNRMERALKFIRTPVKFAENLPSSRRNSEPESDPLCFEDENMSTTDEYKNLGPPSDEASRQAIGSILNIVRSSSVLLLTETWLLNSLKYPTHWKQYHTYGINTQPLATKGSQGISLLVNPDCKYHVHHFRTDDIPLSQYKLSFTIANILIHCLYLPLHLDNQTVNQALNSLPHTTSHTNKTMICGDFNARLGSIAIYTSLYDSCGRASHSTDPLRDFWTGKLQEAYDYRELCYRKWRKAYGLNKLHYWLKHQEARATLRRLITQRRQGTWTNFCKQMASEEYTKAISKISCIRKNRTLKPTFSTPESPQHAADIMASYLEATFSGDLLKNVQRYEIDTHILPFEIDFPFTSDDIYLTISSLPVKKAPGIDRLRNEMLPTNISSASTYSLSPLPYVLGLVICPTDMAHCPGDTHIQERLTIRSSHLLRTHYHVKPVLAFLDIKSAYDTVNCSFIWGTLSRYVSSPMLSLLRCLFDDVQIEILLSNTTSRRFNPKTGVLQGSILSPYLYSVYINQLPAHLRPQAITTDMSPLETIPLLNCLLYADDVVLIAERTTMTALLRKYEENSLQMGYQWNPSKCVILDNQLEPIPYTIYNQALPQIISYAYLGVTFKLGGYLDPDELIRRNSSNPLATMNLKSIEDVQDTCIREIYGARGKTSTKVMLHLAKLSLMADRVHILQAQFLYRSLHLPEDALLCQLLSHTRHIRGHQWSLLFKTPLWQSLPYTGEELDKHTFKTAKKRFLSVSLDPILWLPMSYAERSRCIRWRLGWLPGGKPHPCPKHPTLKFTRKHAITCLNMHQRLYMPKTITDPLSFLLNMLPSRPSVSSNLALSWSQCWPVICSILHELDQIQHVTVIPITHPHG
ncbi:hypothetical protein G6F49_010495 [Rhizopus delemar]|nr:hypothetical protein G6F49_010495 [Rhizopus delemar]